MSTLAVLVLAAGQGTRMQSALPKVLHALAGRPLLWHVLRTARTLQPDKLVVVSGYQAEQVEAAFPDPDLHWVRQHEQHGTGHAVQCATPALTNLTGDLLILQGDVPLMRSETLHTLIQAHRNQGCTVSLLSADIRPPTGYGRVVRNTNGLLQHIVEEKDASPEIKQITEINSGVYCIRMDKLPGLLQRLNNNNANGEYYLPDIVRFAREDGETVDACRIPNPDQLAGINTRAHLAALEAAYRNHRVATLMEQGVTFIDPQSCWIGPEVTIEPDTTLLPNVILAGKTTIGPQCQIGPFCQIIDSTIGPACRIHAFCHIEGATLEGHNPIGPYARLRPAAQLATQARVGNFCEIKKSRIGAGSKISHLSYIGDTEMGSGVNIGAGTITCNYDGIHKHQTRIGDRCFIGSSTQLVAPVELGDAARTGAGSTITKTVPSGALALARTPQRNILDYASKKNAQKK